MRLLLIFFLFAFVAACANTTPVMLANSSKSEFDRPVYAGGVFELDKRTPDAELYRVFQQGATGFVSISSVRSGVEEIATQFCARKGMIVHPVQETVAKPPYIFGNFPRVEWLFECEVAPQSVATGGALMPDKYTQLEHLKKLLDIGALTKEEFDKEKAKLLNDNN